MLDRYNITSERDLTEALERVERYVITRAAEPPKIRPLRPEPAQDPHASGPDRPREHGKVPATA